MRTHSRIEYEEGDVRVVRADKYNFATERLTRVGEKPNKKGEMNAHAGELRWERIGWYGDNLRQAALQAIKDGALTNECQTILDALSRSERVVLDAIGRLKDEDPSA